MIRQVLFDNEAFFEEQQPIGTSDFVGTYSRINVVSKNMFGRAWPKCVDGTSTFAESIGKHSMSGM